MPPGTVVPDGALVLGPAARERGPLSDSARWWVDTNTATYRDLARRHRDSVAEVDGPARQ